MVLSGHTDVVPTEGQDWSRDPFSLAVESGRAYGRGTTDMKGFIAAVLAMAPTFAAAGRSRPVHIALTYDEEEGCHGARTMLSELARGERPMPSTAIIGEPTGFEVVIAHKGCYGIDGSSAWNAMRRCRRAGRTIMPPPASSVSRLLATG